MHELKDYIPIIFNGGSYGTYLNFILTNLSNENPREPFNDNGASHKFADNEISHDGELSIRNDGRFIKYHPKTEVGHSFTNNILSLLDSVNMGVLIYPSPNTILLSINNLFYKRGKVPWYTIMNTDAIYDNWGIPNTTNIEDIPRWVIREWLSFYMMPMWYDMHEWGKISELKNNTKLKIVYIDELLHNFNPTIKEIANFCNIEYGDNTQLNKIYKKMLSLQEHINKDISCKNIITNFYNDKEFEVPETMTVVDEAWIQWKLRLDGYEMYCDGLNEFPKNLYEFKEHTYKT